jgi:hypothetical protein
MRKIAGKKSWCNGSKEDGMTAISIRRRLHFLMCCEKEEKEEELLHAASSIDHRSSHRMDRDTSKNNRARSISTIMKNVKIRHRPIILRRPLPKHGSFRFVVSVEGKTVNERTFLPCAD